MRKRAEHERARIELGVVVRDEAHVAPAKARTLTALFIRRGELKLEARMSGDQGAELASRIPGRAQHPYGKFMHRE
jgi:hypothetical protein